ncbi:MAG: diguanylate cyclase [Solirubrobacteraceae bacterium]|nr:diguanylate cyclase [Solirubrobacteraceae bacterium]
MSFRNRLASFFVLIVIVPMLAVAFLLFRLIDSTAEGQLEAAITAQHNTANNLFGEERRRAQIALGAVGDDDAFTDALRDADFERARARAQRLLDREALQRIVYVSQGEAEVRAGNKLAIAPAVQSVEAAGRQLGQLEVSVTDARAFVDRVRELTAGAGPETGLFTVVVNGGTTLASNLRAADGPALPTSNAATVTLDGIEYRVDSFADPGAFTGQQVRVFTLRSLADKPSVADDRTFAAAIMLGFLLLALACAMLVSRTLQREIAAFLTAARRLAAGDFSAKVPTVGRDEFAGLGDEFNKMSGELERRLAELSQERGRVLDSMRRLGEAVAANLDRDALLELVVRTAVDGLDAEAGRASVRAGANEALEERSRVGDIDRLEQALAAVENDALHSGSPREALAGDVTAIAYPLRGAGGSDEVVGVVSVARGGRPFAASDRDLFSYLAGQVARSMENVELHETAARKSVTDELTGLANRRAFDDALAAEIERCKRFGSELGLVLIDLDDFKQVNDTFGHQQGDVVLREVGRVLREGSREVDLAARYGGEELAVILPGTDLDGAFNRAERIRQQIAEVQIARLDGPGTLTVTVSCGVAAVRASNADGRALVQAADGALYEAKRSGKNKSVPAR